MAMAPGQREGQREEGTVERVVAFLVVLVLPIVSFPLGGEFGPDWQTGNVTDRAAIHLDPDVTIFFAPFIVVAWFAVLASIAVEPIMAERRLTRWLVYSSVPLTLHYLVISSIAFVGTPVIVGGALVGLWAGATALTRGERHRSFSWVSYGVAALGSVAVLASVVLNGLSPSNLLRPLAIPFFLLILGGPTICFAAAVHRSLRLRRSSATLEPPPSQSQSPSPSPTTAAASAATGVVAAGWLVGYGVAWRQAANKAVQLYEELPVEQPTCWVATAAATGHRRVVGSSTAIAADGTPFVITGQLQSLKLAEIVIAAVAPTSHRRLRSHYDRWGRRVASRLSTPVRADLAYAALKPAEWFGRLLTRLLLDDPDTERRRVYRAVASDQISSSTRAR